MILRQSFFHKRDFQSTASIRRSFIEFFKHRDHVHVPSSSVIPNDDDNTLLFVNSGMNQFKSLILGQKDARNLRRVVNYQKCIRVSGKHNDLDDVGRDLHHQTFFEMLGNWSFNGAYDKQTACEYAWEFLVDRLGLDPQRLYISYFGGDPISGVEADESCRSAWLKIGISPDRILPFKQENFWEMGSVGPCGPSTEIHYDRIGGRDASKLVNIDDSVVELWNIVFMIYQRNSNGSLSSLPSFHIDTGMGLERLASAVQNVASNYDIDIFIPILRHIRSLAKKDMLSKNSAFQIIADHLRTFSIAYSDGVQPGHTDAGRQIRMILRRAFRQAVQLGIERNALREVIPIIVDSLIDAYPNLATQTEWIQYSLIEEEDWYWKVLNDAKRHFNYVIGHLPNGVSQISGDALLKLKSQGVSLDLCEEMATKIGLTLDKLEFSRLLDLEKKRGRDPRFETKLNLSKEKFPSHNDDSKYDLDREVNTRILGFCDSSGNTVENLDHENGYVLLQDCQFFAQEGGQAADHGILNSLESQARFIVEDCIKVNGLSVLKGKAIGRFSGTGPIQQQVDKNRRRALMRAHTATHLLNWALQRTGIGEGQLGSSVHPDRLRFEYSPGENASESDNVLTLENFVKSIIHEAKQVTVENVELEVAKKMKHLKSEFRPGKLYPQAVRVVNIVDGVSKLPIAGETCCGTHVTSTSELGDFAVITNFSMGKGARKIIAVTGPKVDEAKQIAGTFEGKLDKLITSGPTYSQLNQFIKALPTDQMPYIDMVRIKRRAGSVLKKLRDESKQQRKLKESSV